MIQPEFQATYFTTFNPPLADPNMFQCIHSASFEATDFMNKDSYVGQKTSEDIDDMIIISNSSYSD